MRESTVSLISISTFVLAAIQLYIGLNMESLGRGALHIHMTVAIILLGLLHIPFLKGSGYSRKVYLFLIVLTAIQGMLGLYMAYIQHILVVKNIHHGFAWIILLGTLVGTGLKLMNK